MVQIPKGRCQQGLVFNEHKPINHKLGRDGVQVGIGNPKTRGRPQHLEQVFDGQNSVLCSAFFFWDFEQNMSFSLEKHKEPRLSETPREFNV